MDFLTQSELAFVQKRWRLTAGVRNVVQILSLATTPLSVQDVGNILKEQNHPVDATTIYRIFERLKKRVSFFVIQTQRSSVTERYRLTQHYRVPYKPYKIVDDYGRAATRVLPRRFYCLASE